ncbi:hypothetical protein ACFFU8_11395 [Chromobacterium piscinae]|uniref:Uncharacterized protein n=1 Tax=Chromobacterium piscinae TaxID=686831 RepID=A0ABV0H3E4_9NEIS|nr:hypothetical protein [Chromobacterium piscinae]MBX9296572.1 hypothetical protein [Chromobacterium vaccinii]MBX9356149.1 hypothetical protein [Chromobacterium vaccinii]MCD5327551.1 hypothetical protein [Chromobacterium piscinae]
MNEPLPLFLDISSHLTGFSVTELEATGMSGVYWDTVQYQNAPTTLDGFLNCSRQILKDGRDNEKEIHQMIASQLFPTDKFDGLAQNIINLWYFGQWPPANQNLSLAMQHNVSPEAYVQGLVWNASQTHPPGAKQPGFGSWAEKPLGDG